MAPTKTKAPADPQIERVPLARLTQYPNNPRRGNVDEIAKSLQRRGQYKPLVVSEDDVVLVGNHTMQAMTHLGMTTALIVRAPVQSTSPEAAEIVLVDNRLPDLGIYDDRALVELLGTIPDLTDAAVGFEAEDLDALLALLDHGHGLGGGYDHADQDVLDLTDQATWPVVKFQISPDTNRRWRAVPGDTDAERALFLLALYQEHGGEPDF